VTKRVPSLGAQRSVYQHHVVHENLVMGSEINKASGSEAKDLIFKAKATNYHKSQHLLLKQSTALHNGLVYAMINVRRSILKNLIEKTKTMLS